MMTEVELSRATGALVRYYHILKLAPREMVAEAYSECLKAGVRPDVHFDPTPDSPDGGSAIAKVAA